jgi:hypothetical protein
MGFGAALFAMRNRDLAIRKMTWRDGVTPGWHRARTIDFPIGT